MKIKKPKTVNAPAPAGGPAAGSVGGAAIADRFRLDNVPAKRGGTVGKKSAATALVFGLLALGVMVALTLIIYKHWEFLMPA